MIRLTENKIAVVPIFDPDKAERQASATNYTPAEIELMKELGTYNPDAKSSLHIPDEAKERADQGIVKYVGPNVKYTSVGDYVLFSGYSGTLMRLEGEGLLIILREDFVTCGILPTDTDIPGLFFQDKSGEYWPATYEQAVVLIAQRFQELQPVDKVKELMFEKPTRAGV